MTYGKRLNTRQVMDALGVSDDQVRRLIDAGELDAVNVAATAEQRPTWRITEASVQAFLARRKGGSQDGSNNSAGAA